MDAVVTAGGIPLPEDRLYPATQGNAKSMLDIAGKPMIQWVLDALSEAKTIQNVIIVGMTEKSSVKCSKPLHFAPNQGRMVDNLRAGGRKLLEVNPKAKHALFVSSDIPAITGEMVDWVVNTAMEAPKDVYYNVIKRETMEKRFPGSKRTWTKLQDMEICGGDMNVGSLALLTDEDNDIWDKITDSRKNVLKQASLIGFGTAWRLLTGSLSLQKAEENIMEKLGISGRAVVCPYAEVGMDVDKLNQLELVRADFAKRLKKAARLSAGPKKAVPAGRNKVAAKGKKLPAKAGKAPVKSSKAPAKVGKAPAKGGKVLPTKGGKGMVKKVQKPAVTKKNPAAKKPTAKKPTKK